MAATFRLSNAAADAAAGDGLSVGLGGFIGAGAKITFYTGGVNTTPETAPAGTKLGTCAVTGSFAAASGDGVIDTSTVGSDTSADDSGTCASFWLTKSDGTTPVADGNVGTADTSIVFDNNIFVSGGTISVSSLSITFPPH